MTKEELKKEAEAKYKIGGYPQLHPDYFAFIHGYLAGTEPREKRIAELEKENAELKKKIGIYQKGMFDEIGKRDKKVIKATELFELFIQWSYGCCKEPDYKNLVKQAEQFIKEIEK